MELFFMQESAKPKTRKVVDLVAISEGISTELIDIAESETLISDMMYESLSEEVNLITNEADEGTAEKTRWEKIKEFFKKMAKFFTDLGSKIATFIRDTFAQISQRFINAEKFVKENEAVIKAAKGTYAIKDYENDRKIIKRFMQDYSNLSSVERIANSDELTNLVKPNLDKMKAELQKASDKKVSIKASDAMTLVLFGKKGISSIKEYYNDYIKALKEAQKEAKEGIKAVDKKDKEAVAAKRKMVKNMNTVISAARTCNNLNIKSFNGELTACVKVIRELAFNIKQDEKATKKLEKTIGKAEKKIGKAMSRV